MIRSVWNRMRSVCSKFAMRWHNKKGAGLMLLLLLVFGVSSTYAGTSASEVAAQLQAGFRTLAGISSDVCIVIGALMFVGGLYQLKRFGEMRTMMSAQMTLSKPLTPIIAGALLMAYPTALGTLLRAFWGSDGNVMAYAPTGNYDVMVPAMLAMVRLIGVISIIRAILVASVAVGPQAQPGSKSRAGMLLVAGLLCTNVMGTLHLINSLFHFSDQF